MNYFSTNTFMMFLFGCSGSPSLTLDKKFKKSDLGEAFTS